jgi:hypothetical protein
MLTEPVASLRPTLRLAQLEKTILGPFFDGLSL